MTDDFGVCSNKSIELSISNKCTVINQYHVRYSYLQRPYWLGVRKFQNYYLDTEQGCFMFWIFGRGIEKQKKKKEIDKPSRLSYVIII